MSDHALSESPDVLRDLELFDLGNARSLAQYEDFSGLDFRRKRASEPTSAGRSQSGQQYQGPKASIPMSPVKRMPKSGKKKLW